jgi:integrase
LNPITRAKPGDCERFQRDALEKPKNWRQQHPKSKEEVATVSPNTILKWSRSLQAAFQRACRNAGKKCVRGVVPDVKLLEENPWNCFTWIEGVEKKVRQFDLDELVSFMAFLQARWPQVVVAQSLGKAFLWSRCRLEAVTSLRWQAERSFGNEHHFHVVEKRGVEWWFRLPEAVYQELLQQRTDSPFVFAAYNKQLRHFHAQGPRPDWAEKVGDDFNPRCVGDWFYDRLADWSSTSPKGHAHPHVFRKTSLQLAWDGDEARQQALADAKVSEKVLRANYLRMSDKALREESNRNFHRIAAALPAEVAKLYGHVEAATPGLEERLKAAIEAKDWAVVARVSAEILKGQPSEAR